MKVYIHIIAHRLDKKQHYVDVCKQQIASESGNKVILVIYYTKTG